MKSTFAILLSVFTAFAAAAPVEAGEATQSDIQSPQQYPPMMDIWQQRNYLGMQHTSHGEYNKCYHIPQDFENRVSSAKARSGIRCALYM
jgi:hypothetical protein